MAGALVGDSQVVLLAALTSQQLAVAAVGAVVGTADGSAAGAQGTTLGRADTAWYAVPTTALFTTRTLDLGAAPCKGQPRSATRREARARRAAGIRMDIVSRRADMTQQNTGNGLSEECLRRRDATDSRVRKHSRPSTNTSGVAHERAVVYLFYLSAKQGLFHLRPIAAVRHLY